MNSKDNSPSEHCADPMPEPASPWSTDRLPAGLYVVATPLGNLADLAPRAVAVLRGVQRICAEDTRRTQGLCRHFGIGTALTSLHAHNEQSRRERIVAAILDGQALALVSDAGTPAISDPGARLVRAVQQAGARVFSVPGPSALTAAWSISGLLDEHWFFEGFLPARTSARRTRLRALDAMPAALVMFEAPHRVLAAVTDLAETLHGERELFIAREISKQFEQSARMPLAEGPGWLAADPDRQRGEFVLLVSSATAAAADMTHIDAQRVLDVLLAELSPAQAARLAARITGRPRDELYRSVLAAR